MEPGAEALGVVAPDVGVVESDAAEQDAALVQPERRLGGTHPKHTLAGKGGVGDVGAEAEQDVVLGLGAVHAESNKYPRC